MQEAIIKDTKLTFVDPLIVERYATDLIILDDLTELNVPNDASAEEINKIFKEKGKTGIGYHYVIRKNCTIKEGLPSFARGSISQEDCHAINIVICGKFTSMLLANLTDKYLLETSNQTIYSKQAFVNSISPGRDLNDKLETLIGKANWYRYKGGPEINNKPKYDDNMISEH